MGAFRDPSTINNVGTVGSTTNPLTGSALGMDRENQKAIKELIGTLDWESLSILDGGITPVSSEIIVDTEDGTPADDLTTINLTSDGTTTLHTGMRIKIKSADPSRVITVKHLTGGGNIRTADGRDVVLSNDWSLDLKLQKGNWVEQKGRGEKIALDAQTDASTALARTAPATTTSRGIGRAATLADMEQGAVVENGPAFLDATGGVITTTPTAHAVPQAEENGINPAWIDGFGRIFASFNTSEPDGLLLNGGAVSRTTYARLFSKLGTGYGAGNGTTTFNLPNARGRVIQGADGTLGALIEPSLPNVRGTVWWAGASSGPRSYDGPVSDGAMHVTAYANNNVGHVAGAGYGMVGLGFNLSAYSSIYKDGATVKMAGLACNLFIRF